MTEYGGSHSIIYKMIMRTYASPSSSESFALAFLVLLLEAPVPLVIFFGPLVLFLSEDSLTLGVDEGLGEGEEMGLASVSEGLTPSSSESSPARARSSASRSAIVAWDDYSRSLQSLLCEYQPKPNDFGKCQIKESNGMRCDKLTDGVRKMVE